MKDFPVRKSIRLNNYDYSANGAYFITICVKDKHEMLGRIVVGANFVRPVLSETGQIVENEILVLNDTYHGVKIDKFIIMPNHIHMILFVTTEDGRTPNGQMQGGRTEFAPTISRAIKKFKGSITKKLGFSLWQKSFYDHIIRNEEEYRKIWQYIDENPARWETDKYH